MAQLLADHLKMLTRARTGERYPSAAEVFLLSGALELTTPAYEVPNLLVHGWVERPWCQDDEWRLVVADFFEAVSSWFLESLPLPSKRAPVCMPVVAKISESLVRLGEFAVHTQGSLPLGWSDQIAWHDTLLVARPAG